MFTSIVSVWRKSATKIARPTDASAAAIAMTKKTTIWPSARAHRRAVAEEGEVGGVHHQLDRQEDLDRVAPQERAGEADREERAGDEQDVGERNAADHASPRRASTNAPTSAASRRTETASKGSR